MVTRFVVLLALFALITHRSEAEHRVWTVEDGETSGVAWNLFLEPAGTVRNEAEVGFASSGIWAPGIKSPILATSAAPLGGHRPA